MNNQKPESKSLESEEGDYAQPINLVAPRLPTPASAVVTTFSGLSAPTANQQVSLRPHSDPPRPGLMLYFRAPTTTRSSGPGHIMSPLMGAQVASAQPFGNKTSVKTIKSMRVGYYQDKLTDKSGSEYNIKVIRVPPNDSMQSQGSSVTPTATLTPGILPSALAGNANRHIVPAAVHPGITTGASATGSMASIIKAGHQASQVGHAINQSFSSHVPRGPAAVASISAGPRSGVATPIVRAPHSSGTMTLASSMISPSNIRVRPQTMMAGRTPITSSTGYAQVIDLQKNSVGHSLSTTQTAIGSASRAVDISSPIRSSLTHPSAITIAKPIVQHLQQVSEKGCLKAITTAGTPSNAMPAHQSTSSTEVHSVCIVPTITRATVSSSGAYTAGIMQFPTAAIQQHVPALRPSLVQPQAMNISPAQGSQAFAVISAKSLPTGTNQAVTLTPPPNRTSIAAATIVPSSGSALGSMSTLSTTSARVLSTSSAVCQTTIPIAKVYPQNLPPVTQISTLVESSRSLPFVSQAAANINTLKTATTSSTTVASNIHIPTVKRSEATTSVRFAPLTKQQTSFAIPSTSYLYDQQCPGTLSVHPYSVSSASQGFSSSQLQTFAFGATKRITELVTHAQTVVTTTHSLSSAANLVALSQASTTHGTNYSQGNVPNHLSPRPSILRKRTNAEVGTSVAKRNLMGSLNTADSESPSSELSINLSASTSPKSSNGPLRENGMPTLNDSDIPQVSSLPGPAVVIKKEPGTFNDEISASYANNEDVGKDACPLETSPRKKPRKQQLAGNELIETHSSDNEESFETKIPVKEIKTEEDSNSVQWVTFRKKPAMSLLTSYRLGCKARNNHFIRYGDVRPKEEKQPSVNELANTKGINEEMHGWKVHHLTGQMEDLSSYEDMVCSRLSHWLDLENKSCAGSLNIPSSAEDVRIINKLTDLVKGNLQRSKLSQEQALESQQQIVKILDHKSNVVDIFSKYASRRQSKKKDKT